jgi:hypothetical protein
VARRSASASGGIPMAAPITAPIKTPEEGKSYSPLGAWRIAEDHGVD